MALRDTVIERTTGPYLAMVLKLMAFTFNRDAGLRSQLYRRHNGTLEPFDTRYQFRTLDGSSNLYLTIENGRMRAGSGNARDPHLIATLSDAAAMRTFLSPFSKEDPLNLMIENKLSFEGNMSYLSRLGLFTAMARNRHWRKALRGTEGVGAKTRRGDSMLATSQVEKQRETLRCEKTPECVVLDDPYLSGYSLDDFPRLQAMRAEFFGARGEICTERPRLVTEYYREHGFETDADGREINPELRQAGALHHVLVNKEPLVRPRALLPGTTTTRFPGVVVYPELSGNNIWAELTTVSGRELNPYRISPEDVDLLNQDIFPYWIDRNVREWTRQKWGNARCQQLDERWVLYFMWKTTALSHTIPDYPGVLQRGLLSYREDAARRESDAADDKGRDFYRAIQMVIDGVLAYAGRLAEKAESMASQIDPNDVAHAQRREELLEMARICRKVPAGPAESLQEALSVILLLQITLHMESMNAGLSLGRLDVWLQPYFLHDVALANTEEERAAAVKRAVELVGSFFLQCNDHLPLVPSVGMRLFAGSSSDMAMTVGGVDREGNSAVCDMTYVILKVAEMLTLRDPNLNARFHPKANSPEYLRRLCEVNVLTTATPSIHNDEAIIATLVNQGFALEDARDWGATGCVEPTSCGRHIGHTNCMLLNTVAALEMALNDGYHPLIRQQVGPKTGDPADVSQFDTFEKFLAAYKEQLGYVIGQSIEYNNMLGQAHQYLHPTPLLSSLVQGCMESARDVVEGGAKYNSSGSALVSVADVIDSLLVIKQLVYEEKAVDFKTLLQALNDDFAGYEALHARIMKRVAKFGSDAPGTLEMAQDIINFIYDEYQSKENYRGGRYTSGFWSMSNHVVFGQLSGALPSGRKRGKAFTPGITPTASASPNLLDNIRTIAALDPLKMPNNIAFNVKLTPAPGEPHAEFVEHAMTYAKTYFELGGMQMQFNMVTTETLCDAMEHPENYRNLMVRISGYNAYFVELNREMQIELIERAEYR
jgi:pyruvate formate-lyase/glycerol dehydratase family glycyl radical enzyme